MSAAPDVASGNGSIDDAVSRLREAEREAHARLLGHPEKDGEGIRLALEHEWALMDLRAVAGRARVRSAQSFVRVSARPSRPTGGNSVV